MTLKLNNSKAIKDKTIKKPKEPNCKRATSRADDATKPVIITSQ